MNYLGLNSERYYRKVIFYMLIVSEGNDYRNL